MSIEFVSNKALSFMEWLPPRDSEVESKVARFAIKFFVIAAFTLFVCAVFFRGRASLVMKNDVQDQPVNPSSKTDSLPGLPNFGNWCYANVVTQLIVYIPDLERLLLHAEPKDRYGKKLQKDLLALVQVMKRNGTCSQVHAASKKYRNTFLTNLKKFRTKELNSRSKKPNDVVDYMHYLGERLGIFEFNDGQVAASFSLIVEGNFPTSLEQKARVLILSFSESKKGGYSPPDSITVNGQIYELKGYINRPKSYGHFTSMTKVSDGSWIKQDDLSVSRKVSKERRDLSGVYVMCYVLP